MNLGVEEQAQRKKKDRRSRRNAQSTPTAASQDAPSPKQTNHAKLFKSKTMKVEQRNIGLIIGPGGKNIKKLYDLTHCDILLPYRKRKKMETETATRATASVDVDSGDYYYVYDSFNGVEETNIYSKEKNHENEKGGSSSKNSSASDLKSKNHKNGANANANGNGNGDANDELDDDDPRKLVEIKLRGSPEEIRDAEVEITFMIKRGRLMLPHERDPQQRRSNGKRRAADSDDYKNSAEYADAVDDVEIAEDMRIPSKICGMLIGGGGARIKELTEDTGAEIWVDWDKDSHIEAGVSTVHLKGTRFCVESAKAEIRRIQRLFEKGSNTLRFEIPAYRSKDLWGDNGQNLRYLQKEYNVSITVKNYTYQRNVLRIGSEHQRIQRTLMVILVGEEEDQMQCKLAIDELVGTFRKCPQCNNIKEDENGYSDSHSSQWFCNDCWDDFNGVTAMKETKEKQEENIRRVTRQMDAMSMEQGQTQQQHAPRQPRPPQPRPPPAVPPQQQYMYVPPPEAPPQHQPRRPPYHQPQQPQKQQGGHRIDDGYEKPRGRGQRRIVGDVHRKHKW